MGEFWEKSLLLKYFLHGILFSGIFLVMGFVWAFVFVVLVVAGLLVGFILGLILLFFIIGWINVSLAGLIWDMWIQSDWKSLLVHGFLLFVLLIIAGIPSIIVNLIVPSLAITLVFFIINCLIDGFVAKNLAEWFEE
jgi:hypothetical protein